MKEWTTHCQTCDWTGVKAKEVTKPNEEKDNHLKSHPGHKARVWVTGEESLTLSSASLYDKRSHLDSLIKTQA